MQASNYGGTFDQLFLGILQKMPLYFFYTMVQKKSLKNEKTYALNLVFSSCAGISENVHCVAMLPTWVTRIFVSSPGH